MNGLICMRLRCTAECILLSLYLALARLRNKDYVKLTSAYIIKTVIYVYKAVGIGSSTQAVPTYAVQLEGKGWFYGSERMMKYLSSNRKNLKIFSLENEALLKENLFNLFSAVESSPSNHISAHFVYVCIHNIFI